MSGNDTYWGFSGFNFPAGSGGTPSTSALTLLYVATAGENLTAGDVVRLAASGGATAGQAFRAQANATDYEAFGVVKTSALLGAAVDIYVSGSVPTKFSAAPALTDNGKIVYLSATIACATITAPTVAPTADLRLGRLVGADGVSTTPNVLWNAQTPLLIP